MELYDVFLVVDVGSRVSLVGSVYTQRNEYFSSNLFTNNEEGVILIYFPETVV